jgi:hypothetical protein
MPDDPLQEPDPWRDTEAGRGPERDDPYDNAADNPLGASPELLGVPNFSRGGSHNDPSMRLPFSRTILVVLLAIIGFAILYQVLSVLF